MESRRDLIDYLREHKPKGFSVKPRYCAENDTFTFFADKEEAFAKRIDALVTVYCTFQEKRVVGFEIKGLKRQLEFAKKNFSASGSDGKIKYVVQAIAMTSSARNPEDLSYFEQLGRMAENTVGPETDLLLKVV